MSAYEDARKAWGFPRFAEDFPRHEELDALVVAFAKGDYRAVRAGAPKLIASVVVVTGEEEPAGDAAEKTPARDDRDAVKKAAATLLERTKPDPGARVLFALAAGLLAFLTIWWVTHDGPPAGTQPTKPAAPVGRTN